MLSWNKAISKLANAATNFPQAAFTALTRSLQNEWLFVQRVLHGFEHQFSLLKDGLNSDFLPSLFGADFELSAVEKDFVCRPARMAGLGINDPVSQAPLQYQCSKLATKHLTDVLKDGSKLDLQVHLFSCKEVTKLKEANEQQLREETEILLEKFPKDRQRTIKRKLDNKCSGWLTVLPREDTFFELSADEFRDALALRYGRTPCHLPAFCDADGEVFDVNHALNCPRGGLVYGRHNETRDLNCNLLELAGLKNIISEPVVIDSDINGENGLRADWAVRGFWEPQKQALFDVCILNADAKSVSHLSLSAIFNQRKEKKKETYSNAATARRATFTPIIATCDAVFEKEAETYIQRLGMHLSKKWKSSYSRAVGFLRARMQICILRSVSLCLRGSRTKWKGLE